MRNKPTTSLKAELILRSIPYWTDIYSYERGDSITRLWINLKYLFRDKHGDCDVPRNVLEAIVDTMMPDIRAFFESEEGQREFEEWKKEREKKQEIIPADKAIKSRSKRKNVS